MTENVTNSVFIKTPGVVTILAYALYDDGFVNFKPLLQKCRPPYLQPPPFYLDHPMNGTPPISSPSDFSNSACKLKLT